MHTFGAVKIIWEYIIVKVPSIFIEESSYKGVDGREIILNVMYNPERHVRNYGIVTSIPDELLHIPLASDHIGAPSYRDYPVNTWKTNQDIELDVRDGDKVYFHHNCLLPDQNGGNLWNRMHLFSRKDEKGKMWHYFMVKYSLVFASVRYEPLNRTMNQFDWGYEPDLKQVNVFTDGKPEKLFSYTDKQGYDHVYRKNVIMIGSYVFIEPDMETWEDISIPIPVVVGGKKLLNPDGSIKMKPKEEWLVTKKMPEEHYLCGWVRHCGSPLKGDKEFLRPGMYVYFQRFANTKVKFEGFDYFRMRQRHIFGIAPYKPIIDHAKL